jgi:membrane-associated protein
MHNLLDPSHLVKTFGYLGILITIFLESGVVIGFFLPGDSLLFAAGLLASQNYLSVIGVMIVAIIGAIAGNNVGYYTGKKAGPSLFKRKDSRLFSNKRIAEAHTFFEEKGGRALVLARFIPAVRTFVPIVAGIGKMDYKHFVRFNALGALLWGISMPILGYSLGKTVPNIDTYILPVIAFIIVLSLVPVLMQYLKRQRQEN